MVTSFFQLTTCSFGNDLFQIQTSSQRANRWSLELPKGKSAELGAAVTTEVVRKKSTTLEGGVESRVVISIKVTSGVTMSNSDMDKFRVATGYWALPWGWGGLQRTNKISLRPRMESSHSKRHELVDCPLFTIAR